MIPFILIGIGIFVLYGLREHPNKNPKKTRLEVFINQFLKPLD